MSSSSRFPQWVSRRRSAEISWFLRLRSVGLNLGVVLRWILAVYRHIPHLREAFGNTVRWLWVLAYLSAFSKIGSLFWYRKHQARCQDSTVQIFCARQTPTSATRLGGAGRNHVRVFAHLAQYEEAIEAIIARTIFCYLLVSTPWSSFLWLLRLCRVFYWCFVYVYPSRSPLGMAASTLGRLHGIFSDIPEMLRPLTSNQARCLSSRSYDIFVQTCRRELGTSDVAHV